jgi:GPH family glycoside/pentoside/hexuronide:cation symporter
MQMSESSAAVAMRTKLWFGIGATGEAATNWIFTALTFFYYNQILGLSGTLAALAVTIGLFGDAITDPLMGSISDRFRSRLGRRHPFMFAAPLPLIVTIYLVFHPPEGLSEFLLFCWFAVFTVLMRTFTTLFAVPHLALGAELSADYNERSKVMSYNNVFSYLGGLVMHVSVWFWVFPAFENGQRNAAAYEPIVFLGCTLILACIFFSTFNTRDRIPFMKVPKDLAPFSVFGLFQDVWQAVQNRHYMWLLLGLFFLAVMIGTHETLGIYMNTFFWELSPTQIGWLIMGNVVGYTLGFTFTARLHERFDKRWTIVATAAGLSVFWSGAVTLRLLGLAPDNGTLTLVLFIISIGSVASTCGSILNISVMSALADIADEHDMKTGRRQEGIFYSARTFFAKATNGVGHIVAGIALDLIEFPTRAEPGLVAEDKLFALGIVDGPFAMVWGLIAAVFYAGYRIDKKYHAKIRAALRARDGEAKEGVE